MIREKRINEGFRSGRPEALSLRGKISPGSKSVVLEDNDAALQAKIRSYSPVLPSLELVMECLRWDLQAECSAWCA